MRVLLAVVGVLLPHIVLAQAARPSRAPGSDVITIPKMRADVEFLAGDALRGRLTDTPENAITLEWVAARFKWLGLKPMGASGSYFLPYGLSVSSLGTGSNELAITRAGQTTRYGLTTGFYPHRSSASTTATGDLVFAHFGITAEPLGYNDLGGDVRGKVLLILEHEPGENDSTSKFDGVVTSEYTNPLKKALAAQARGAAAVLFVTDVQNHQGAQSFETASRNYWPAQPPRLLPYTLSAWADKLSIPAGQISVALADSLVRGAGKPLADLARAAEGSARGSMPIAIPGVSVTVTTSVVRRTVTDRNVLAAIEGSDPVLKNEWVVIAAHPDHNGAVGDTIYPGADDNASGAAGLLAIAEAYAKAAAAGQRPRRSVLFASFNSEERGPLMGSWGYTEAPSVPLDRTIAMINLDMIGRNEEVPENGGARFRGLPVQTGESNKNSVTLLGWSRSTLTAAAERANARYRLTLKKNYDNNISQLLRRSDSWAFLQHGVPAIWFHNGLHPDYHLTSDTADRLNYEKMERIVELVHQMSWDLANASSRPSLTKKFTP
jgi:Zn-dependent M28 family amino/carboxypeptidase